MRSNAVRHLSIIGFIVIAIVYLAIIQGLGQLLTRDLDTKYAAPTSVEELWRSISVGVGASLVFVYLIVAILHWWRPVFVDDRPVQRWVIVIPIVMVVAILAGTNYSGLADRGGSFTALLLLTALMVGFAEEGMFRGIGVVAPRTTKIRSSCGLSAAAAATSESSPSSSSAFTPWDGSCRGGWSSPSIADRSCSVRIALLRFQRRSRHAAGLHRAFARSPCRRAVVHVRWLGSRR